MTPMTQEELEKRALALAQECESVVYEMNDLIFGGIGKMFDDATELMLDYLDE